MDADWDLLAVVRGARSSTATSAGFQVADPHQSLPPPPPPPNPPAANYGGGCQDLLQDLYKPFVPILERPISAAPPNSFGHGGFITEQLKLLQEKPQQQILFHQPPQPPVKDSHQLLFGSRAASSASIINHLCAPTKTASTPPTTTSLTPQRPKKRKNLQKKVCHVPVEGLSSDMWAWRKYGQKPIKGSPYPRGYYRCSSSKGCPARKQVERNKTTPKMFIVTYTSEHNHPMPTHRNSLAGTTRNKPSGNEHPPSLSPSTVSPSAVDKGVEIKPERDNEEEEEEEIDKDDSGNEMDVFPDMVLDDDFFVGFEELDDTCDQIQATPQLMVGVDFLDEQDWDLGLLHSTSSSS